MSLANNHAPSSHALSSLETSYSSISDSVNQSINPNVRFGKKESLSELSFPSFTDSIYKGIDNIKIIQIIINSIYKGINNNQIIQIIIYSIYKGINNNQFKRYK